MLRVKRGIFLFNDSLYADAQSPQKKKSGRKIDVYLFLGEAAVCSQANFMTVV